MTAPGTDDRDVVAALLGKLDAGESARLRWGGVVTQASPLLVDVGGSGVDLPAAHLSSYTPVDGDSVVLLQQGRQFLVLGTYVPTAP